VIIQGRVVDKATNIPIPFIAVKLDDLLTPQKENIRDFTDGDGVFDFNVVKGPYQLEIRSPVHSPFTEIVNSDINLIIKLARITF
jgi:hypothetical protein